MKKVQMTEHQCLSRGTKDHGAIGKTRKKREKKGKILRKESEKQKGRFGKGKRRWRKKRTPGGSSFSATPL